MQVGNKCPGLNEYHSFESRHCLTDCDHQCIPASVLVQIENKLRVDKHYGDYVSVTALLGCARQLYLERKTDYYLEPAKNWYSIRGTLLHNILENPDFEALVNDMRTYMHRLWSRGEISRDEFEPKWIEIEARLMDLAAMMPKPFHIPDWESEIEYEFPLGKINGKERKLKGTIDVLRRLRGQILDYKTIGDKGLGVIKKGAKDDHIWQFNMYRFLVERGYPVGESYSTYHAPTINSIQAFYMTMMQVVGTGTNLAENTDWLVASGDAAAKYEDPSKAGDRDGRIVGQPEVIGVKEDLITKKGKKKSSTNPDDFELQNYKKFRVTYAVPEVPLYDLDDVEKLIRERAPVLFDAFERGFMPPMCAPDMREWKCDNYCPDQVRQACDKHNESVGVKRVTTEKSINKTKKNLIPVAGLMEGDLALSI